MLETITIIAGDTHHETVDFMALSDVSPGVKAANSNDSSNPSEAAFTLGKMVGQHVTRKGNDTEYSHVILFPEALDEIQIPDWVRVRPYTFRSLSAEEQVLFYEGFTAGCSQVQRLFG